MLRDLVVCFICVQLVAATAMAEPSVFPTGTTILSPGEAWESFVLFGAPDGKTHLIDMDGNERHSWAFVGLPSKAIEPSLVSGSPGHILVQIEADDSMSAQAASNIHAMFRNRSIGEVDWNGRVVWKWGGAALGDAAHQHHDMERLDTGKTLVLTSKSRPIEGFAQKELLDDEIKEVAASGLVTWKWVVSEHLGEFGFTEAGMDRVRAAQAKGYFHLNSMRTLGPNKWARNGDKRFAPENIIVCSRNANLVAIIARDTGHVVWRLGPDYDGRDGEVLEQPRRATGQVDQVSGIHDAHLIADNLPGAGNILLFDNEGEAGYPPVPLKVTGGSRVLEIDPATKTIVWSYTASRSGLPDWTFYSSFLSDSQRLPNGNTLIVEGMNGRFFQVTASGKIVWEYVSPFFSKGPIGGGTVTSNWVYRAQAVPYKWMPDGVDHESFSVQPIDNALFRVPRR